MKKTIISVICTLLTFVGVSVFADTNINLTVTNNMTPEYSEIYNPSTNTSAVNPQWGGAIPEGTWVANSQSFSGLLQYDQHISFAPGVYYQNGYRALGNFQVQLKGDSLHFTIGDFETQPYSDVLKTQDISMAVHVNGNSIGVLNSSNKEIIVNTSLTGTDNIDVIFTSIWNEITVPIHVNVINNTQYPVTAFNKTLNHGESTKSETTLGNDLVFPLTADTKYDNTLNIDNYGGVGIGKAWMNDPYMSQIYITCSIDGKSITLGPNEYWKGFDNSSIMKDGGDITYTFNQQ